MHAPEAVQVQQLRDVMSLLEQGVADLAALRTLAAVCTNNPAAPQSPTTLTSPLSPNGNGGPLSPSPLNDMSSLARSLRSDVWLGGKMFDKVFNALVRFLDADTMREVRDCVDSLSYVPLHRARRPIS